MNYKVTIVLLVVLTLIASTSVFAQQAAEITGEPAPLGEKPEAPKVAPHPAGNRFFGMPTLYAEGPLSEGFEGGEIPADWAVYNEDGDSYTWSVYTYTPHTGTYYARVHWNYYGCDDWLVTPKLTVAAGDSLSYWASNYSSYYLEEWEVYVSTTGNTPSDFLSGTMIGDESSYSTSYLYYAYDLSAFAGQDVWVAFRCVSVDAFYLNLDDISGPDLWVPSGPVAAFNTTDLAFGKVGLDGSPRDLPLIIYSAGTTNLTVSGVSSDNAHFTHDFSGATVIPPGDSLVVTVSFMPTAETEETGTLTVTHDGTKTESYISLSGTGVPGLFFEDFEVSVPPPGWAHYRQGSSYTYGWYSASGGAPDFTGYAAAHYYEYYSCDDWLVSPPVTIPASKYEAQLEFWQWQAYASWMDYHGVWISTGSGDPNDGDFVELASLAPGTEYTWEPAPTLGLVAYAGETIYIAFVYQGYDADWWAIDDVYIGEYVNQPPEIVHDPKGDTDDTTPTLTAIITDVEAVTATAYYETPAKAFVAAAMTPTGVLPDEYSIDLPAMPYGTVNYYIEADDGIGGVATTDIYSFDIQEFVGFENIYDDGTLENATCWNPGYTHGRFAVRFTPMAYPCTLSAVKLGIAGDWPDAAHQQFAVEIYDDDGAGGTPGTLLYGPDTTGSVGNIVGGVPPYPALVWAYVCIKDEVIINSGDFYVAKEQFEGYPDAEGLDIDQDGIMHSRSWEYNPSTYAWEEYYPGERNLMIRAYTRQVLAYGDLEGTVSEAKGAVEGAIVTAAGGWETRSETTDASGYYFFDDLIAGTYDVSVCMPGYESQMATDVEVVKDETTTQDFVLFSCGALLCEGFEGDFPPCQWASYELGDPAGWQQDDYQFYSGNFSAFHDDNNVTTGCDDWLVTPPITLPPFNGAQLEFMQYQNYYTYYEYHGIHVSTGSGDPNDGDFVELVELGAGTEDTWEAVTPIGLSAYAGQTIYLAFVYQGDYADEWWIDDVYIMRAPFYLSDGSVDPALGNLCTSFTYSVTYTHEDDVAPTVQDVYIDGVAHAMTDATGGAGPYSGGVVFTYEHQFDVGGYHNFFFYFKDGNFAVKYPISGILSGPMTGWYAYDFEDAAHFTATGPNDKWEWGTPTYGPATAHSGANCWGTDLDDYYYDYCASRLETPHLDFTTGGDDKLELMFWHWYDTEFNYDGGNVKLFTPSDTVVLHPDVSQCPDYDDDAIYSYNYWIPDEPGYSGHDQKQWEAAIFDLTPWTDESDVVIAFDFGSNSSVYMYPGWFIDDVVIGGDPPLGLPVVLDIKPGSCPNPLNIPSKGVIPVAILGTEVFDVTTVDPATCLLEGVAPLRWALQDVSTPVDPSGDVCDCNELGADGYTDLTLKYNKGEVVAALDSLISGQVRVLTLRGLLTDGCTPIQGQDCMRIKIRALTAGTKTQFTNSDVVSDFNVDQGPNPFNLVTEITFTLPERTRVSLVIYNVLGQKVRTLVQEDMDAGTHSVLWDSRNDEGSLMASGIYFYRFETEKFAKTMKMVLIK